MRTEETEDMIINAFLENSHMSLRRTINLFVISKLTIGADSQRPQILSRQNAMAQQHFDKDEKNRISFAKDELERSRIPA